MLLADRVAVGGLEARFRSAKRSSLLFLFLLWVSEIKVKTQNALHRNWFCYVSSVR